MPKPRNKSADPFVQVTFSKNGDNITSDKVKPEMNQSNVNVTEEIPPKAVQWNELETKLLLRVMSIMYTPISQCKDNKTRGIMYDKSFAFFKQKLEADNIGNDHFKANITKQKMVDKWFEMKKTFQDVYMAAISNKTLNPHPREKWSYFDDMAEILKEDRSAFPQTSLQPTDQQQEVSPSSSSEENTAQQPLKREDLINEDKYSSDLYIFREQLEEQVVNHRDCLLKKSAKTTNNNNNNNNDDNNTTTTTTTTTRKVAPSPQTTMIETPAQPAVQYTNVTPPGYMQFFQMVESVREANREHICNTRALFEEMQMRTTSERLKRKADMEEFENRYIIRRRTDEERMSRLLSSQREIIDIVQGLLNNSRREGTDRSGN